MATKAFEEHSVKETEESGEGDEVIQITDSHQTSKITGATGVFSPTHAPPGVRQDTKESEQDPLHSFETLAAQFTDIDSQLARHFNDDSTATSSSSSSSSSSSDDEDRREKEALQQAGDASSEA
eukprot:COSAG02_NODE_43700_length_372_cov_0.952381_1_plen_123_part_11